MGNNLMAMRRRVMMAQPHKEKAEGAIASFVTNLTKPMLVTASITPVQDLSGGEPYPPGGGKNKCNAGVGRNEGKLRGDDGTELSTSSSGYTEPMDGFLPNTNYTISGQIQTANGAGRIYFLDSNGDWISRTTSFGLSEMPYTFTTPANCRYIEIQYNNAYTALTDVQIELGSTATPYSPYSNICPIYGWTGAEVTGAGVNLIPDGTDTTKGYISGYRLGDDGSTVAFANMYVSEYFKVKAGETYTYLKKNSDDYQAPAVCFYDGNKTFISGAKFGAKITPKVVTVPNNAVWARATQWGTDANIYQFEEGSASEVVAYSGTTLSVTFPNPPGTVYGGTLQINKDGTGVLTVTHVGVDMGSLTWNYASSYAYFTTSIDEIKKYTAGETPSILCETYKTTTSKSASDWTSAENCTIGTMSGLATIVVKDTAYTDKTVFTTAVTGKKVVYPLATPVTYTLTSQQVGQLLSKMGVNHVWATTGDCAVEYSPDTDLWIQKVLAGESA